jgi:hypothetical protein
MKPVRNPPSKVYWFPAKQIGWGWGPPNTWQGWLVLAVWMVIATTVMLLFARTHVLACVGFLIAMSGLLTLICYMNGEPPGWRSGDRE